MCCRKSSVLMFYVKCMKMMHDWIPKKCWKESDLFCFKNLRFCWHCALYCWIFTLRGWKTFHCFQKYRAMSAIKNENSFFIFMESQSVQCQSSWCLKPIFWEEYFWFIKVATLTACWSYQLKFVQVKENASAGSSRHRDICYPDNLCIIQNG